MSEFADPGAVEIIEATFEDEAAFKIDIDNVPDDVDPALAAKRNRLISSFRDGKLEAEPTYVALVLLSLNTDNHPDKATRGYLLTPAWDFPREANMDPDYADTLYGVVRDVHFDQNVRAAR